MPATAPASRTAWITGGSSGIGAAIALELARLGHKVVIGARRQEKLAFVKAHIEKEVAGAAVTALPLDVVDDASVDAFLAAAEKAAGPCDILVNNAGLALGRHRVDEADFAVWDNMLDVNVRAAFRITKKVVAGMIERAPVRGGDVVMIGSVAGSEPYANGSMYCASKAAVAAFARALRAELLGKDIRVLLMEPGMVETEFSVVRNFGDAAAAEKVYAGMRPVSAQEVAECVAFALTRPRHVSLDSMQILATDQLGTQQVFRRPV